MRRSPKLRPNLWDGVEALAVAALAVACLLPLPVAVKVLRQRFKEIEGGELDAAGQY